MQWMLAIDDPIFAFVSSSPSSGYPVSFQEGMRELYHYQATTPGGRKGVREAPDITGLGAAPTSSGSCGRSTGPEGFIANHTPR